MPKVPSHIFREYDIRGLAEEELTSHNVRLIAQAYGTFLRSRGVGTATVGGDVRHSTRRIMDAAIGGLTEAGVNVIDLGTVATPCFYWSLHHFGVDGGIMVTGSHNPKEFNGLKLAFGKVTLYGDEIQEIRRIIEEDRIQIPGGASVRREDIKEAYISMLASKITLGSRKLKVVVDSGNGTGGLFAPEMLRRIGCEVIELFSEPDGTFPNHHPDPTKRENLPKLIETVRAHGADAGVGFDGDSDRIGVVDDQGEVIWGDRLMILYWSEILPKHPGAEVIVEVKSSMALPEEAQRMGGRPLWWKSGHSLIKAKMKEISALFAGEVSGHMFFADEFYGFDDAFYAAGRLMRILSNTDEKLSQIMSRIPKYPSTAETRVDCPNDQVKFQVVERVVERALKEKLQTITVDGVRIIYPNGWGLVRASNTQPVLVTRCEGRTQEDLDTICKDMKARLLEAGLGEFEWEF
ncbi:Phosphomannomutase [Thermanaerovibrio acidaminovorans DSM 6589]|uniref:Phosphomannomutase n=1 Tax=Thermanaerovibrio acidaminovorans (strain ATCC 49978 / DSM 6589 / Su883) TaxID=525903 RepID=D1B8V1_THEAS|nr:phosphomannomutase/phosphoglucomutase [Thermanaerovibrio acidaminovorans]ACZ18704.1 Phosphomannomutase [Thermanaerovibrio acidaminovorans DSM 6589]